MFVQSYREPGGPAWKRRIAEWPKLSETAASKSGIGRQLMRPISSAAKDP
jgi:hypothetical protein